MCDGSEKFVELLIELTTYCDAQQINGKRTAVDDNKKDALAYIIKVGKAASTLLSSLQPDMKLSNNFSVTVEIDPVRAKSIVLGKLDALNAEAIKVSDASTDPDCKELFKSLADLMISFKTDPATRIVIPRLYWILCTICGCYFAVTNPNIPPPYTCPYCGAPYWHFA